MQTCADKRFLNLCFWPFLLPPTFAATCIILFPFYDRMQNAPPAAADDDAVIQKYFGENKQPFAYAFHLFLAENLDCSCRGY